MAQAKDVAAMRMRIIRTGYREVKVERKGEFYLVQGIEPLAGQRVMKMIGPNDIMWVCR